MYRVKALLFTYNIINRAMMHFDNIINLVIGILIENWSMHNTYAYHRESTIEYFAVFLIDCTYMPVNFLFTIPYIDRVKF